MKKTFASKGVLIHTLTDANGMPLANLTTPANGDERAQVIPLLDAVKPKTGKTGRPRKHLSVIVAEINSGIGSCDFIIQREEEIIAAIQVCYWLDDKDTKKGK